MDILTAKDSLKMRGKEKFCSCKPVKLKWVFGFILKMETPVRDGPSARLNNSNHSPWLLRSVWSLFYSFDLSLKALKKRKWVCWKLNSPTTPAVTPWRQPAAPTESHPWLLRRLRAPFIVRSSIHRSINWYPWKSRGGPATPDRTKHESASIPFARARLHTIVLLGPVSLNNRCLLQ